MKTIRNRGIAWSGFKNTVAGARRLLRFNVAVPFHVESGSSPRSILAAGATGGYEFV
jgi:hypothetical protein